MKVIMPSRNTMRYCICKLSSDHFFPVIVRHSHGSSVILVPETVSLLIFERITDILSAGMLSGILTVTMFSEKLLRLISSSWSDSLI